MFAKKQVDPLTRYVDPTRELPNRELALADWYIRHKALLRRIVIVSLLVWSAASVAYSFWQWADYLFFGYAKDEAMLVQLKTAPNYGALHTHSGAAPLVIGAIELFETTPHKYDIAANVENPNARWIATVTYKFMTAAGETSERNAVVLPGARLPLVVFGFENSSYPATPELIIVKTAWQRVNPHLIRDVEDYISERVKFSVAGVSWKPADLASGRPVPELSFDIQNDTAYSYWQPVFHVTLRSGSQPVGYIYLSLDQFKSGEKRSVEYHLLSDRTNVSDIDVLPVINVFDRSIYMEPESPAESGSQR